MQIVSGGMTIGDRVIAPELPYRVRSLDVADYAPTGGTIAVPAGHPDVGAVMWANPDKTLLLAPGVYPETVWRKPPGYGYTTVKVDAALQMRRYGPADIAAGVRFLGWRTSQVVGEIPYKVNMIGIHGQPAAGDRPVQFRAVALMQQDPPTGLRLYNMPSDWLFDRCVYTTETDITAGGGSTPAIVGPNDTWRRWALLANCINVGGIRSHFGPAHYQVWPNAYDSQGIGFYMGPGPFTFQDCFSNGAEEGIANGNTGNEVSIPFQTRNGDYTFIGCHIWRPRSWRGKVQCKNGVEMKQGSRVLFDTCIVENTNRDAQQVGSGMYFWSSQEEFFGGVHDITIRNSWFKNVAQILGLSPHYQQRWNAPLARVAMQNCVATGFNAQTITASPYDGQYNDRAFSFAVEMKGDGVTTDSVREILIERVSVFTSGRGINELFRVSPFQHRNLRIRKNLMGIAAFGSFGGGVYNTSEGAGNLGLSLTAGTPGCEYADNVIVDPLTNGGGSRPKVDVDHNWYPTSIAALGMVDPSPIHDPEATAADLAKLRLSDTSTYKGSCADGSDAGPDFLALSAALANVRSNVSG